MSGLTLFGGIHTAIGLLAVAAGFVALCKRGAISTDETFGKSYIMLTVVTCATGFFIFHHGGFGAPHALGILTLAFLLIAWLAERRARRSPGSFLFRFASQSAYSLTLFFHFIPGVTETLTRLPVGRSYATGPEDPLVKGLVGFFFLAFLALVTIQAVRLRKSAKNEATVRAPARLRG